MLFFPKDPIKEARRLTALLAENKIKVDEAAESLHIAARAKIEENKATVAAIEEESLNLFKSIEHMAPLPPKQPDQKVNKMFTPDEKVPTLKDNFKVLGHIGKKMIGRGNTILSDSLHKLTANIK